MSFERSNRPLKMSERNTTDLFHVMRMAARRAQTMLLVARGCLGTTDQTRAALCAHENAHENAGRPCAMSSAGEALRYVVDPTRDAPPELDLQRRAYVMAASRAVARHQAKIQRPRPVYPHSD